jgi:tRNA threonylcarbamoyladenosine biosynthesis protein TsaB
MICLAIETSGRIGSVALARGRNEPIPHPLRLMRDSHVVESRTFAHGLRHAAAIVPMLDDLCRSHRIRPTDVELLVVNTGPGSFTGLRVGVTIARTFALTTSARVVAVSSSEVLVENLPATARHAIVVLDAKRGQVFGSIFSRPSSKADRSDTSDPCDHSSWTCNEPPHLAKLSDLIRRAPRPMHLIGEGIPFHRDALGTDEQARALGVIVTGEELWRCRAEVVARLGLLQASLGKFVDPAQLLPQYIRLPEAEEKRLAAIQTDRANQT